MDVLLSNLPAVITMLISMGVLWKYISVLLRIIKETKELLEVIIAALSDKVLTKEEIDAIAKEAKDIAPVIAELLKSHVKK